MLTDALQSVGLGITEVRPEECAKLVGVGTDGAASNVAYAGLKGPMEISMAILDVVFSPSA